jgi:uncharacterized phiE125 gp8 family phage protein
MHRRIVDTIHPATSYISIDDAKEHLRVVNTDEDGYIAAILEAAFDVCENYVGYPLRLTSVQFTCYTWPLFNIDLPGRFQSLESVKYYADITNALTTLSASEYTWQAQETGLVIRWNDDTSLPDTFKNRVDGVQFNTQMGFVPGALPGSIRAAVLLNLGDLYEERKNTIVGTTQTTLTRGAEFLLNPYKIHRFI